jgi:VanZ family protein
VVPIYSETWRAALIRYAPILLWIGVILYLGSDSGSMTQTSRFIGPLLHFLFPDAPEATIQMYHAYVRKSAHFIEYAFLAVLTVRGLSASPSAAMRKLRFVLPVALVALIAVIDETIQSLGTTRTGSAWDVLIDLAGGITAVSLLALFGRRGQKVPVTATE